ncbi:unnamed protein product [Heterobilharzia americana]|nr:unnamed protein product [Heterobilharzia americana]
MASTSVLLIPLVMVVKIIKTPGTFIQEPSILYNWITKPQDSNLLENKETPNLMHRN